MPLAGERAETVAAWRPDNDNPVRPRLVDLAADLTADLAATTDLTLLG